MASVYKRGKIWYVKLYVKGQRHRLSSGFASKAKAQKYARKLENDKRNGKLAINSDAVYFWELLEGVDADYAYNSRRSNGHLYYRGKVIRDALGQLVVYPINGEFNAGLIQFKHKLLQQRKSNATINRYFAIISRAFTLAAQNGRIPKSAVPLFQRLKEAPPRVTQFTDAQLATLLTHLPNYIKPVAIFAAYVSWRRGEILNLRREWVSLETNTITLPPGSTKSGKPRTFVMPPLIRSIVESQLKLATNCTYVFHREGQQIKSMRTAWEGAMRRAGLTGSGLTFHDLRRTARRLLERAGVSDRVAMEIMGHSTRWVFDNYRSIPLQDLQEAADKLHKAAPDWATKQATVDNDGNAQYDSSDESRSGGKEDTRDSKGRAITRLRAWLQGV